MQSKQFYQISRWFVVLMLMFSSITMGILVSAQDSENPEAEMEPATVELTAAVGSIDGTLIYVGGLPTDISSVTFTGELTVGAIVTMVGVVNEDGVIVAQSLVIIGMPTPTPEATADPQPEVTATPVNPDNIIVIQGPVQNININIITIYDINITVAPRNPILNLIAIGDIIRVEGVPNPNGAIVALLVSNVVMSENVAPNATVSVQGPIESINGNVIVVNGISVQLDPADPQLTTLQIGNFIDVQGNFVVINNNYVLSVVNIIIINNTFVGVPPYCKWSGMSGMGHWKCQGYWLYTPGYWYCEWRGMGMGMGMGNVVCVNPDNDDDDDDNGMGMGMGMGNSGGMGMGMGMGG